MSRFSEPQDPTFQALNNSIAFDWRLAPYDIEQSLAHVRMLGRQGIIERGRRRRAREGDSRRFGRR